MKLRYTLPLIAALAFVLCIPARAQVDSEYVDQQVASAGRSVNEGRIKDGVEILTKLLQKIDPAKEKDAYWKASAVLIEALSQTENHSLANQVINTLIATKIPQSQTAYLQWTQYYLGRNLAWLGNRDEGEKLLRVLTAADARLVYIPAQRAAALMLSKIELDRRNIAQSAIWMRRAVIGTLVDQAAASDEIVDVLTKYAIYLSSTRRLLEANILFAKLEPIYNKYFDWRGPRYLYFASHYLFNLTALGSFPSAEILLKRLNDIVAGVDVAPSSVKEELFFQNLYQSARVKPAAGEKPVGDRLKKIVSDFPDFLKQPQNRIQFSYYALSSGDIDLADQFNSSVEASAPLDDQFAAYAVILRSFIAAHRSKFAESIALARDGVDRIRLFHQLAENESSMRLPALSIEERLVLSLILGIDAGHISTFDQANTLFQLQQYLNRDKSKLGLNAWAARQEVKSDLQREDLRSRDRLLALRDKILEEAADALLARLVPIRNYSPGHKNDYAPLVRLEDVEDKISRIEDQQQRVAQDFLKASSDSPIDLGSIQKLLGSNEALVLHAFAGGSGLVTTCINSKSWTFNVQRLDATKLQVLASDYKDLIEVVHEKYEPSAARDSKFPSESSFRLYENMFGGIDSCLQNKTHIFLATDPDFFSLPWNALLTKRPPENQQFSHRNASWLPKSYSLSLLPSVRSLYQLRTNLAPSRAAKNFLGVGAPDLKGAPERNTEIALAPLFVSRGVANRVAIEGLEPLPETAHELRDVAKALGTSESDILLGAKATERGLRNLQLNDYRVISFATHALVADRNDGITEPALVLTPGTGDYNEKNDGLLTVTEIENLTLDANLVILSACNTAASDGQASGRGLSGLADAFFFAGARSVAVTQWEVGSDEAKKLGSGLVARSVGSRSGGVAEGLRQTMVNYISAVSEDYLAHPRFWAPFIIAGDGAVRPLDGADSPGDGRHDLIRLEWEDVAANTQDLEFIGLAKNGRSIFALGMQNPPEGEKRAGSYLARLSAADKIEVVHRAPEIAASNLVQIGNELGVLGYLPTDQKSSAVFRLLKNDGREKWRYVETGYSWNFPLGAVKSSKGYTLFSIDKDFSPTKSSTLIVTQVSDSGSAITQRRYPILISAETRVPKNVIFESNGTLTVAIPGRLTSNWTQPAVWTNPKTGSKSYCVNNPDATVLLSLDAQTLDLRAQRIIENDRVLSMRQHDGHLYAAISVGSKCNVSANAKLVEISPEVELRTIFQTTYANSVEVSDLEVTSENFVLVGKVRTFFPPSSAREAGSAEDDTWDSIWEKSGEQLSALILVIGKDGGYVSDRVLSGVATKSLTSIVAGESGGFVAAGETFSNRGWIMAFTLRTEKIDLWDNIRFWLKGIWTGFGWAH